MWLSIFVNIFVLLQIFADMPTSEMPIFSQTLESLLSTKTRTHLILSGYLRKSMTLTLYPKAMTYFEIDGEFLPHELPLKDGKLDRNALDDFMMVFCNNPFLETLIVSDPYKQVIVDYLDVLLGEAREVQVVNFVYKINDQLVGEIKDAPAFLKGAQNEIAFDCEGGSMVFFGCGGVSSAIAIKLAPKLKKIGLVEIDEGKKERLYTTLKRLYPSIPIFAFDRKGPTDFSDFDIFYNGTGSGKFSKDPLSITRSPLIEGDILPGAGLAIDANYTPWQTLFLKQFAEQGFETLNGYSHMIASTTLHLSFISGKEIDYQIVKRLSDLQQTTSKSFESPKMESPENLNYPHLSTRRPGAATPG